MARPKPAVLLALSLLAVACRRTEPPAPDPGALRPPPVVSSPDVEASPVASSPDAEVAPAKLAPCRQIADEIAALRPKFPQLADFGPGTVTEGASCRISYAYRCHRSTARGGWVAAVPNPDPDGVWFHLGLWDENDETERQSQINTQPFVDKQYLDGRRVNFLILEGKKTRPLGEAIRKILQRRGMR